MNYNRKVPMALAVLMMVMVILGATLAGTTLSTSSATKTEKAATATAPVMQGGCAPVCTCTRTISAECCGPCYQNGNSYCKSFYKDCGSSTQYCYGCACDPPEAP